MTMKLALFSDLHLETYRPGAWSLPPSSADIVILAGDIASQGHGLDWAARTFPGQTVIYITGNHEYYGGSLGKLAEMRARARQLGIHFLEQDTLVVDGVRFLGATLWSDFALFGADKAALGMAVAGQQIGDYFDIQNNRGKRLTPADTLRLHRQSLRWLDQALAQPFAGKTVVISHFAPHRQCVAPIYQHSPVSPYFVSDLAPLLARHRIDLWCHGHTHTNTDFITASGCRVLSNQRGYPKEFASGAMGFRDDILITL